MSVSERALGGFLRADDREKAKAAHRTAFTYVWVIAGARLWKTSIRVRRTFRYAALRASFAMLRWILRLQTTLL
jgi:hypothetical protein